MPEICTGRKIVGSSRLRTEPDGTMGLKAEVDQYGKRGKNGTKRFIAQHQNTKEPKNKNRINYKIESLNGGGV